MTKAEMLVIAEHAENYPVGYGHLFFATDEKKIDTAGSAAEALIIDPELLECG